MKQPTYDSVWKALPDIAILALIRLAVPNIGTTLRPWTTDMKVLFDRDLDNAYLVEINGVAMILLLEYQNYFDATMALRIYHYVSLLKLQYYQRYHKDIPVLPIVIWAIKAKPPAPKFESVASPTAKIVSTYHQIRLNELDWQTVDPLLLVLAPFLQGVSRNNLEAVALRLYAAAPPEQSKLLLGALLNLSRRTYHDIDDIEQAILQQVRLTMDEIIEAIAEGPIGLKLIERGKAEGKAEGKVEGKAEGKVEGEAQAITIFWRHRFGTVPTEVDAALTRATSARLQQVLEAFAAGTPSEAEVRAILGV